MSNGFSKLKVSEVELTYKKHKARYNLTLGDFISRTARDR